MEWAYYINGYPRKWIRVRKAAPPDGDDDEADMDMDMDLDEDVVPSATAVGASSGSHATKGPLESDNAIEEMDEEAMMNASADQQAAIAAEEARKKQEEEDKWEDVLEPMQERHRPREPVVSVLQHLSTVSFSRGPYACLIGQHGEPR